MICFTCRQPAVGQCPICWRFYCSQHGNRRCFECFNSLPSSESAESQITGKGIASVEIRSLELGRASQLRRVVTSMQQHEHQNLIISLISVEVYDDGFAADFRLTFADSVVAEQMPGQVPILFAGGTNTDGTACYASPTPAIGSLGDWRALIRFEPALRSASGEVSLSVVKIEWLPMPSTANPITRWYGPWSFQVTLD